MGSLGTVRRSVSFGVHIRFTRTGKAPVKNFVMSGNMQKNSKKSALKPPSALRLRIDDAGLLRARVSASAGEFNLSPEIIHLLCLLQQKVPSNTLASRLKQDFKQLTNDLPQQSEVDELLSEMRDAGCLVETSGGTTDQISGPQDGFGDPWIQWAMLADRPRCRAYHAAIKASIGTKSVVVDVGAGTGLLSLYALQAGARQVHAIEETSSAKILKKVRQTLPVKERENLILHNINSGDADLPEDVSHIVSELFGNDPLQEGIIHTLRDVFARTASAKTKGIPESFEVIVQFAEVRGGPLKARLERLLSGDNQQSEDWWKEVCKIREQMQFDDVSFAHPVRASDLHYIGEPKSVLKIPLAPPPASSEPQPSAKIQVAYCENSTCPVLLVCFRAHLSAAITISNIPNQQDECEHWSPIVVPLRQKPEKNENLTLRVGIGGQWERITAELSNSRQQIIGSRR